MKTLIVYTSQTGFTKRYAEWLAERVKAETMELKEAQKKKDDFFAGYEAIVYGGWANAESVAKVKWFLGKATEWKDKRLALFCVGASLNGTPRIEQMMQKILTDEQRGYIRAFYCQGGINYEKMSAPTRLAMKMFVGSLKKKKDATPDIKEMAEMLSKTCDISDRKYIEPIAEYLEEAQ